MGGRAREGGWERAEGGFGLTRLVHFFPSTGWLPIKSLTHMSQVFSPISLWQYVLRKEMPVSADPRCLSKQLLEGRQLSPARWDHAAGERTLVGDGRGRGWGIAELGLVAGVAADCHQLG